MNIQEQNLVMALRLGIIDWFQYFELFRKLNSDKDVKVGYKFIHPDHKLVETTVTVTRGPDDQGDYTVEWHYNGVLNRSSFWTLEDILKCKPRGKQ